MEKPKVVIREETETVEIEFGTFQAWLTPNEADELAGNLTFAVHQIKTGKAKK